METEHEIRAISMIDQVAFEEEVKKLAADGWQIVPGFPPVAIYHLVRQRAPVHERSVNVQLGIDDSKVGILRNGKMI